MTRWTVFGASVASTVGFQGGAIGRARRNPVEALKVCDSIDRCELTGLPTLILAWAHIIALGDLGRPMMAAKIAEEIAPMAAASPGTAYYQAVILTVYYTEALILGGCLPEVLAIASQTSRHCANAAGRAQSFATAISGRVALGNGDLHTAIECLRCAVADFADATDGASYNFGIDYAEALARSGDVNAADRCALANAAESTSGPCLPRCR